MLSLFALLLTISSHQRFNKWVPFNVKSLVCSDTNLYKKATYADFIKHKEIFIYFTSKHLESDLAVTNKFRIHVCAKIHYL